MFYYSLYLKIDFTPVETLNNFSYWPCFRKPKGYITDLGKRLKVFLNDFNGMFTKFMTMSHLLILIVLCFPLQTF